MRILRDLLTYKHSMKSATIGDKHTIAAESPQTHTRVRKRQLVGLRESNLVTFSYKEISATYQDIAVTSN